MGGLYNMMGQFGGLYDNWQMNQYNDQMGDWQRQNQQYSQDMDYWGEQNQYDQDARDFSMWSTGASNGGPINPRQMPNVIGPAPNAPEQMNWGGFGGGGGGGGFNSQAPQWGGGVPGAFDGASYQAPDAWDQRSIDTAGVVDPAAAIASAQPGIMENMNSAFADAGNRFGSSGMVGTPYAGALGEASRGAANDLSNIANQYTFQANSDAANRQHAAAIAEYQGNLNAWGQQGNWAHQGQMGDQDRGLAAWGQLGDWQNANNMGQNMFNQQNWQQQGNWDMQQQQMMMPIIQQMMGMFGGGMY